jgi:hypothetical protein
VDLFLDVERRCVDDEVGPVLLVLAAPDQLRVQVARAVDFLVGQADEGALVGDAHRRLLVLLHHRLVFGGGDVLAGGLKVLEGFDAERGLGGFGHAQASFFFNFLRATASGSFMALRAVTVSFASWL